MCVHIGALSLGAACLSVVDHKGNFFFFFKKKSLFCSVSGIFMNFIAGVVLVIQEPMKLYDYVTFSGGDGEVKNIGLTHTVALRAPALLSDTPLLCRSSKLLKA